MPLELLDLMLQFSFTLVSRLDLSSVTLPKVGNYLLMLSLCLII